MRALLIVTVVLPTLAFAAVPAQQQTAVEIWSVDGQVAFEGLGRQLSVRDDFNQDGVDDLLSINPQASTNGFSGNGVIQGMSGSSGDVLWRIEGTSDGQLLGSTFPKMTDLNGDGIKDLFTVTSEASVYGFIRNGQASAYSGASGLLLWSKFGMADGEQLGEAYAQVGDLDGDGTPEIAIGSATASTLGMGRNGYVEIVSGQFGYTLWHRDGISDDAGLGSSIAVGPDVDGDGQLDVLAINQDFTDAAGYRTGKVTAFSARTGQILWEATGGRANARLGQNVIATEDLNGDGTIDVLTINPDADGMFTSECGSVVAISGVNGSTLWQTEGMFNAERLGVESYIAEDLNLDGTADLILGSPEADAFGIPSSGHVTALSGANGSTIWRRNGNQYYGRLGANIELIDDVNGDGLQEVLASSPESSPYGMAGAGSLEMISGGSGFPIWAANGNQPGMHLGSCVLSVDDVNGDGMVDIMLGCRYADLNGLQNNGLLRALSGANGLMLWEYVGESSDMRMGEYLRATKDLNGDGSFDVISWSESADTGGFSNNGCIRAHDGASGSEIWRYDGASSDERMGDAIAIGDDFDLDGVSDIYVATSYMDSQGLADNGRVVALSAGTTLSLDDNGLQAGTSSTLTATGFTSNAEVYFLVSLEGPGTSLFSRRDIPVALKEPIHMIGSAFSDASGIAEFLVTPPSKLRHTQIWMQAIGQGGGSGSRINRTPVHPAVIY